jgi:hypothetical protein
VLTRDGETGAGHRPRLTLVGNEHAVSQCVGLLFRNNRDDCIGFLVRLFSPAWYRQNCLAYSRYHRRHRTLAMVAQPSQWTAFADRRHHLAAIPHFRDRRVFGDVESSIRGVRWCLAPDTRLGRSSRRGGGALVELARGTAPSGYAGSLAGVIQPITARLRR